MTHARNGNHVDLGAAFTNATDSGANVLVIDLNCGAAVALTSVPRDADTGKPVFTMDDGE